MQAKRHNPIKDRLSLKYLTLDNLGQFNDLLRYSFQVTSHRLLTLGYEVDEIKQTKSPILETAKVLGWFDKEKLASQIALYPMKVNIHGSIYSMGGITGVGTYPEYSGMGLMKDLIRKILEEMRQSGQTISFLYPYSIPYYRKKGWEIVCDRMTFKIKDTQLPQAVPVGGIVERVPLDHSDINSLYNEFASKRHGALIRTSLEWDEYWRWEVEDIIVAIYYDENSQPKGFVVYTLENDIFKMKELVHLNEEARHGLWNYISAHLSMVDVVKGFNYEEEPIAFLLEDGDIEETIRPYYMARIVDVQEFLVRYPFSGDIAGKEWRLRVEDPVAEWNSGSFRVFWDERGKTHCERTSASPEDVLLDIQTLTTLLMSYRRASYLKRLERIYASDDVIEFLESLIPEQKPYFSDYF